MQGHTFISLYDRYRVLLSIETDFTNYHLPLWDEHQSLAFAILHWPLNALGLVGSGNQCFFESSGPLAMVFLDLLTLPSSQLLLFSAVSIFFFVCGRPSHIYTSAANC